MNDILAELSEDGRVLNLSGTMVTDLGPLARLTSLTWLNLGGTQVTDVGPLAGLTKLKTLSLQGTQVTDLAPLAGLQANGLRILR